ncbi:unnamed protein product, partial [Timema podura]|nr:unnamed protein product [Timema podura]
MLTGYFANLKLTNSPKHCMNMCLQSGFQYAGVQYSTECFCGNEEPPSTARLPDSSCNMKCPADPREACGGIHSPSAKRVCGTWRTPRSHRLPPDAQRSSTQTGAKTHQGIVPQGPLLLYPRGCDHDGVFWCPGPKGVLSFTIFCSRDKTICTVNCSCWRKPCQMYDWLVKGKQSVTATVATDGRGKKVPGNKLTEEKKALVKQHIISCYSFQPLQWDKKPFQKEYASRFIDQ